MPISFTRDLTGQIFGRLLVVEYVKASKKVSAWRCQCSCGNFCLAKTSQLNSKRKKSCGCLKKDYDAHLGVTKKLVDRRQAQVNRVFKDYQHNARRRQLPFELSYTQWYELTQKPCYYCGIVFSCSAKSDKAKNYDSEPFLYNGIDRIDSKQGYTLGNCVPCCKMCNIAKKDFPQDVFLGWIKKVYKYSYENSVI